MSGRIVEAEPGSRPVPWAYVNLKANESPLGGASAVSDAQGRFTLEDIAAGPYSVLVKKERYKEAVATLQVEEDGTAEIQIPLESTAARPVCVPAVPIQKP